MQGVVVASGSSVGAIDVELVALAKVSGRLVFDVATPPQRVMLLLHAVAGGQTQRRSMKSDAGFVFGGIPVGTYRAEVRIGGATRPAGTITVTAPATENVILRVGS